MISRHTAHPLLLSISIIIITIFFISHTSAHAGHSHGAPATQQQQPPNQQSITGYTPNQPIDIQCMGLEAEPGQWGTGPRCFEAQNAPLSFPFGADSFLHCSWLISEERIYEAIRAALASQSSLQCRVAMAPGANVFIPLSIPLFGFAEDSHVHLFNHYNVLIHVNPALRTLMGVSMYPLQDRLQPLQMGTPFFLHGPIRYLNAHSLLSLSTAGPVPPAAGQLPSPADSSTSALFGPSSSEYSFTSVVAYMILASSLSFLMSAIAYKLFLRPNIIKKYE